MLIRGLGGRVPGWAFRFVDLVDRHPVFQSALHDRVQRLYSFPEQHPSRGHIFSCCSDQIQLVHRSPLSLASKLRGQRCTLRWPDTAPSAWLGFIPDNGFSRRSPRDYCATVKFWCSGIRLDLSARQRVTMATGHLGVVSRCPPRFRTKLA